MTVSRNTPLTAAVLIIPSQSKGRPVTLRYIARSSSAIAMLKRVRQIAAVMSIDAIDGFRSASTTALTL
jgi:hypothetical protein